ncbi:MAG: ATP-binding protein, partial [Anaerolineae bacterium]
TPDAVPQMAQALRSLVDGDRALFETAERTKDGRTLSVEVNACLFEYRGEMAVLSTVRDISERRRLEEQLLQSRKMESIGRLAGGIAHDFNNILMAITGHANFALEDTTMAAETRDELTHLLRAAGRAADLTRQLLAFSRRQVIAPRVVRLNDLISDMEKMLQRMVGDGFALATEMADNLWLTSADPTQMQQVLINLVVNGRDAMSSGGTITIRTANAELRSGPMLGELDLKPGAYVVLSVSDTGSGMTDEVRSRIFEPFFTTKDVGKGTGMGLATALGIVKQHHGSIRVTSTIGKGTTFEIYLPRAFDTVKPTLDGLPPDGLPTGDETVLLVEDDEHVRSVTARALRSLGYQVLEAPSGEEAEAAMRDCEVPVDLLLADIVMSGINGHELATRLLHSRPGLKVLFVSGHARATLSDADLADDGDRLLPKPFTTEALAHKVRKILDTPSVQPN